MRLDKKTQLFDNRENQSEMAILSHLGFCKAACLPMRDSSMPVAKFFINRCLRRGFTLVEMLAVMTIIIIMLGLLAPVVGSFTSTAGRNGAVNILMNTMEQARVAALESGRTVYVVLARRSFPDQDAIMVVREQASSSPLPAGQVASYEKLTRWIALPKGILLHSVGNNILEKNVSSGNPGIFDEKKMPAKTKSGEKWDVLAFNSFGGVIFPDSTSVKLMLIVAEGVRDDKGTEALISNYNRAGGFEIISLRRYTGRASLEVTTL